MFDISLMTQRKTDTVVSKGYKITGYILTNNIDQICIVSQGAVKWLTLFQYWKLMHEQDESLFDVKPVAVSKPELTDKEILDIHTKWCHTQPNTGIIGCIRAVLAAQAEL